MIYLAEIWQTLREEHGQTPWEFAALMSAAVAVVGIIAIVAMISLPKVF
jgi:hypothetical protein